MYTHMGAHIHIVTYTLHMPTTKHMYIHMHIHMSTNSHTCSGSFTTVIISRTREPSCCLFSPNTCSYDKENRKGLGAKDRKRKWPVHRSRHWAASLGGVAPGKEAEAPCGIWAAPPGRIWRLGPDLSSNPKALVELVTVLVCVLTDSFQPWPCRLPSRAKVSISVASLP